MQILCEGNYRSLLLHGTISAVMKEIAVNYQIITIFNFHNSRPSKYCFKTQIVCFSYQDGIIGFISNNPWKSDGGVHLTNS